MKTTILICWVLTGVCFTCSAEGLLQNAGFETKDLTGWDARGTGWSVDEKLSSEGACSTLCSVSKGDKPELRACVQKISGVKEGKIVEVSADVSGFDVVKTPNSKACLAVLCFDDQGQVLKEYRSSVDRPGSAFQSIKIDDAVVLPGTRQVYIMLVVEVFQPAVDGDWWRFDNVQLSVH